MDIFVDSVYVFGGRIGVVLGCGLGLIARRRQHTGISLSERKTKGEGFGYY